MEKDELLKRKNDLEGVLNEVHVELHSIDNEIQKQKYQDIAGKYFKNKELGNVIYHKVVGLNVDNPESIWIKTMTFEMEEGLINNNNFYFAYGFDFLPDNLVEITRDEFYAKWLEFVTRINMLDI